MAAEGEGRLEAHALAFKLRAGLLAGTDYVASKVLPKAKIVLPYLLAYYVFPTIASLAYTLITQKHTIHHMRVDLQSLDDVEMSLVLPTLVVFGGTQVRNLEVKVGFGESRVHACTLVSHTLHEWKHHQRMHIHEKMAVLHNEKFDARDITAFVRERKNMWVALKFDLGVSVLVGSIYLRMSFRKSINVFGNRDDKVLDIVDGTVADESGILTAAIRLRPRAPEFLQFSAPGFAVEAYGVVGDAEARRLYAVSTKPFERARPSATVQCTARSRRADIENIKDVVRSQERGAEKTLMVFRPLDTSAFSAASRRYIDAAIRGVVIEPAARGGEEARNEVETPLVRVSISRITPDDIRGTVYVHRALFPNVYVYELARNLEYENCSGRIDLDGVKIASGYFHNRVEQPDQYVSCEFWGEINDWATLICRVLHPDGRLLSIGTDGTHSMLSYFLDVWRVFVDFRRGIQATSLGCMQPRPPVKRPDDKKNNIVNVHLRVVEDEGARLRLAATVHTDEYRTRPFTVLEISEDQFFVIPHTHVQAGVSIKKSEVVFNIEESIGRVVSIGRPAEIDVVFEKLAAFSGTDHSRGTTEESVYCLLAFLLLGARAADSTHLEKVLEDYAMSSCVRHAPGMRKASVMLQEVLGYDRYKVLFTFQGDALEDALVNIELCAPSAELCMLPKKNDKMSSLAFVRTEIEPFVLRMQVSRSSIALQEAETALLLSIFVKFSADLMARQFTFMYDNKETLFSCMLNFCMNFFQVSLDMLGSVKHEKRGHGDIKHFSPTVPRATLDVDVHMDDQASVCARLHIDSESGEGSAFSIDTERIRVRAVGLEGEKDNPPSGEREEEVLLVDISPLGINLRQKNNGNFCQREVDICVWTKMCILYCHQYEVSIEYGERGSGDAGEQVETFMITRNSAHEILLFLGGFYGVHGKPSKQNNEAGSIPFFDNVIRFVQSVFVKKKPTCKDEHSRPNDAVSRMSFAGQVPGEASENCEERRQQVIDVRCSYDFLRVNKIIGSIMKRVNLERYPQVLSFRAKLRVTGTGEKDRALPYEMVVDDFPITYQSADLQRREDTFRMRLVCSAENRVMLKIPSCGSAESSLKDFLTSTGITEVVFNYDHNRNMYFTLIEMGLGANVDLCIEVYSGGKMSLKFNTEACMRKGSITIVPLFLVPLNFFEKQLNLLVKVYVNTTLLHCLEVQTEGVQGILASMPKIMMKNRFWNVEGAIPFRQSCDLEINKEEFETKFATLCLTSVV